MKKHLPYPIDEKYQTLISEMAKKLNVSKAEVLRRCIDEKYLKEFEELIEHRKKQNVL